MEALATAPRSWSLREVISLTFPLPLAGLLPLMGGSGFVASITVFISIIEQDLNCFPTVYLSPRIPFASFFSSVYLFFLRNLIEVYLLCHSWFISENKMTSGKFTSGTQFNCGNNDAMERFSFLYMILLQCLGQCKFIASISGLISVN